MLRYLQGIARLDVVFQRLKMGEPKFTVPECVISWKAELQDTIALSTTEAEYMAAVEASKEVLWLRRLVETFSIIQDSIRVHCDSQNAIHLTKDHRYHNQTKHIDVRFYKIR